MNIVKSGAAVSAGSLSAEDLALINGYAKTPLTAEEVYAFSLLLCDNEVDRDGERFDTPTLEQLAALFVGKTGISDHDWRAGNQVGRVYRAELVRDGAKKTSLGEDYAYVKAWAYLLRTAENAPLIAAIEGGIRKETSVGCAVEERLCSVCGAPSGSCEHVPGRSYGGKVCHTVLHNAVDAYEWSFVAVPAQRAAGVTKGFDAQRAELEKLAELGRAYENSLRQEVLRLCLVCDRGLYKSMEQAVKHMDAAALLEAQESLRARAGEKLPLATQLPGRGEITRFDGGEYII